MSKDEFSGFGFAPGVVRGTRSFEVDNLGRLTGVNYKQVWTPSENQAECRKRDDHWGGIIPSIQWTFNYVLADGSVSPAVSPAPDVKRTAKEAVKAKKEREERDELTDCQHGFYGYYDGSNDYYVAGRVMGVIEGYGETVIGTRGFRCMKARIVALRIPKHVSPRLRARILRNYPDVPVFGSFKAMVAEFPPDAAGAEVTPDTDPDFWTRSA